MRALLFVSLLLPASYPQSCWAFTEGEWLGLFEAVSGATVLKKDSSPIARDKCSNCGGTGQLGDGTVSVVCPVCEGTGKPIPLGNPAAFTSEQDCLSCQIPGRINSNPIPPGKDAPAAKQDAVSSGGSTYKRRLFRRR